MPVYDYECKHCGNSQEAFFKIGDKPDDIPCVCGKEAVKVMSNSMVLGDDMPAWMRHRETLGCLQSPVEKPISSRSEYKRYLKQKGIAEV
jgi:putative FmdB family regulatory protein